MGPRPQITEGSHPGLYQPRALGISRGMGCGGTEGNKEIHLFWPLPKIIYCQGEILQKINSLLAFLHPAICRHSIYTCTIYSISPKQRLKRREIWRAGKRQSTGGCWGVCKLRALGWAWPIRLR